VGLSGEDAQLISAVARSPELGFVGDVENVNAGILERLLSQGLIPVVATIGADVAGQSYNINADTVAGAIAEALSAERLVYLTNVEGLRTDVDDPGSRISAISAGGLDRLLQDGVITEGMIPKLASCVQALRNGVRRAHILDGRVPHVLLLEFFTDEGVGTMVEP
jgi:acetylglutamate kinase